VILQWGEVATWILLQVEAEVVEMAPQKEAVSEV